MAKKKDDGFLALIQVAIMAAFSVFLINTAIVNRHFANKYNVKEAPIRVTDSGNILRFVPLLMGLAGLVFLILMGINALMGRFAPDNDVLRYTLLAVAGVCIVIGALMVSARIGTTQIGMLIFPEDDVFVIPTDPNKNTFTENVLQGQLISNMFSMEELPLSGLKKITRQSGKKAFLHGTFGTRCVTWRNKQKRDECIASLEEARGKRLTNAAIDD